MKWHKDSIKIAQRQIAVYRAKTAEYLHAGFMEAKKQERAVPFLSFGLLRLLIRTGKVLIVSGMHSSRSGVIVLFTPMKSRKVPRRVCFRHLH